MISSISSFKPLLLRLVVIAFLFALANMAVRGPIARRVDLPVEQLQHRVLNSAATILVVGDSHAQSVPFNSVEVLNLSSGGDSFAEMRSKLRFAGTRVPSLEYVLVPLDLHCFSGDRDWRNNFQQGVMWCSPSDYQQIYDENYWKARYIHRMFPLINPVNARLARRYLLHAAVPETQQPDWSALPDSERRRMAGSRFRANFAGGYSAGQANQFRALLRDAERFELRVVGVRFPVDEMYGELVEEVAWREKAERSWRGRLNGVIDFSSLPTQATDFVNQDHLRASSETAETVARRIERACRESQELRSNGR